MKNEMTPNDAGRETVACMGGTYLTHLDETKRGLAKLLARENISVRHEQVPTAMFNVITRELILPQFESISVDQYDLLIAHEVGHAKYSSGPVAEALLQSCGQFPGLHTYVNVLEDTRIERLMKNEYPGLRGSFRRGYHDFALYGPLFQLKDRELASLSFIDRINVHYKVGADYAITFSAEEQAVLPRVDALDSFTAVFDLAKELYDRDAQALKEQKQPKPAQGQMSDQDEDSSDEGEETAPADSKDASDSDDSKDSKDSKDASKDSKDASKDSKDASKDGEGDSESDEAVAADGAATKDSDDAIGGQGLSYPIASTDVQNAEALKAKAEESIDLTDYSRPVQVTLASLTSAQVAPHLVTSAAYQADVLTYFAQYPTVQAAANASFASFMRMHGQTISYMSREFELRKAARCSERAKTSRSGRLDVSKLYAYQFREDLFHSVTTHAKGQSHGIVVLIDASGSMSSVMSDTLDQALIFGAFAKATGIPFQALAFTEGRRGTMNQADINAAHASLPKGTLLPDATTRVVTLLDTQAPNWKAQQTAVSAFKLKYEPVADWTLAARSLASDLQGLPYSDLGCTPLYGATLITECVVAQMKSSLRLDKMTLLIVTDGGDSNGLSQRTDAQESQNLGSRTPLIIRDAATRQVTEGFVYSERHERFMQADRCLPQALATALKARHECRVVNIRILPSGKRREHIADTAQMFARMGVDLTTNQDDLNNQATLKRDGQIVFTGPNMIGDALILVASSRLRITEVEDTVVTKTQNAAAIRRAFVSKNVAGSRNKVFVQAVMPFLA
jgi:hypothetical protein